MQQQQNSLKTWQIFESKKLTVFMCDHHTSILAHWLPARFHFTCSVFWTMRHTKHKHCTTCCFARCLNSVSVLFFNSCNGDCLDARLKHNWAERALAKLLLTFIIWWSLFTCAYWFTQCERLCIVYAAVCPCVEANQSSIFCYFSALRRNGVVVCLEARVLRVWLRGAQRQFDTQT